MRPESDNGMSRVGIKIDASQLEKALKAIRLDGNDLLQIEGAGQWVLVNGMRIRVPVDSGATRNSIMPHIIESTGTRVVDDVGPETIYAPNIEYGIQSKPNYPIQPFVRPTVEEDGDNVQAAISHAFAAKVNQRWPK